MNKISEFLKKYSPYVIALVGLIITILLTIAIVYLNKCVFTSDNIKLIPKLSDYKLIANNLIGFAEGIVVFQTFILFLNGINKK
ncbi:MAG: hypothetical protein ACI35W_04925 [Anaeroplasmataceae bacterium]